MQSLEYDSEGKASKLIFPSILSLLRLIPLLISTQMCTKEPSAWPVNIHKVTLAVFS